MKKQILIGSLIVVLIISGLLLGGVFNKEDDDMKEDMTTEMNEDLDSEMKDDMDSDIKDDMDSEMKDESDSDMMEEEMSNPGVMAENFSLKNLDGEIVSLKDFEGEKVYVKFWASWCSICLAGLEDIDELSLSEDVKVITIVAPGEKGEKDKDDFIEWFKGLGYENIEVLLDEDGMVQKAFNVRGFPTSAYIGSDQVLIQVLPGHVDNDRILKTFETIY